MYCCYKVLSGESVGQDRKKHLCYYLVLMLPVTKVMEGL